MYLISSFCWILVYIGLSSTEFVSTSKEDKYFASKEAVTWEDAKRTCVQAGYELVSVQSFKEKDRLETFLDDNNLTPKDPYSGYWLAGVRHSNGSFYWDTVNTLLDRDLEGWNDLACTDLRRYLCQKK
ncbi:hypothetical protein GWI33_022563 [Rhynchophorus ferrugineus]|uniref:C-type lectin domain-containing protein n=1 Tax=Rhynchophorus ferrugineus TaxID=354439 RepID=A0A834IQ22_RHYFE|nr:hypothetical protein GWI33_022563 [Rhynchophorus ferrugineus]